MFFKFNVTRKQLLMNIVVSALIYGSTVHAAEATPEIGQATEVKHFAIVNGETITLNEFQSAVRAGIRKRFYHGKVPPEELVAFKKEVSQTLIDRVLLVKEATRQKIVPDEKFVNEQLGLYEKRYENQAFWKNHKDQMLAGLKVSLEEESLLSELEKKTKSIELPSQDAAQQYYLNNQSLFTTPKKMRVSLILLKVAPSSPADVWEAATKEAEQVIERLKKGADFSQLARIHSGDDSASKGGDMGFMHEGMLAPPAQKALNEMNEGEVSDAIMLLQGIAILRLEERQESTLNPFDKVAERAAKLLQRQTAENSWSGLIEKLRQNATVEVNTAAFESDNKVEQVDLVGS